MFGLRRTVDDGVRDEHVATADPDSIGGQAVVSCEEVTVGDGGILCVVHVDAVPASLCGEGISIDVFARSKNEGVVPGALDIYVADCSILAIVEEDGVRPSYPFLAF